LPLVGQVVDWAGEAVEGARVQVDGGDFTQTGAAGRFDLGAFPAGGLVSLRAEAAGLATTRGEGMPGVECTLVLQPLPVAAGSIQGSDGVAPGAPFHLTLSVDTDADGGMRVFEGEAGTDGLWRIEGLPAGRLVEVRAEETGGLRIQERPDVALVPGQTAFVHLVLPGASAEAAGDGG